jgi:hypothetical protein
MSYRKITSEQKLATLVTSLRDSSGMAFSAHGVEILRREFRRRRGPISRLTSTLQSAYARTLTGFQRGLGP